jgi:hypothetical protein
MAEASACSTCAPEMPRKSLIISADVSCSYVDFIESLSIIYEFVAGQFVTQLLAIHPPI